MDPRHKLAKSLDQLFVDSENTAIMSARTDDEAARTAASSGVTPDGIKQKLVEKLEATHVDIEDLSGELPVYSATVRLCARRLCLLLVLCQTRRQCHETVS